MTKMNPLSSMCLRKGSCFVSGWLELKLVQKLKRNQCFNLRKIWIVKTPLKNAKTAFLILLGILHKNYAVYIFNLSCQRFTKVIILKNHEVLLKFECIMEGEGGSK